MALFHRFARILSDIGMAASVAVIIAMTLLILTEVVLRTYFASSTYVMDELIGYGIAATSFLALGQSLAKGTLLRMNLLIAAVPHESRFRTAIEVFCALCGMVGAGMALFYFARNMVRNFERGYVSETIARVPLWLPELFMVVGLSVFLVQLLSYFIRILAGQVDLRAASEADLRLE